MESNRSKTSVRTRSAALNWVDYLVIAATILTFLAVVIANNPHTARAQGDAVISASELPDQSQSPLDTGLLKARIRLTIGQL